ncbi:M20 family metallopeptidase [Enterococcus termitis]|uniref:M20 family metallopeptidase n=1 Tax=Enterococcus termitis TaxID=332950 RepID=UPI000924198B|nr:ArgE/DapE family deacylase [Enterococcus termitis]OJG99446.1 acetylornithine deacetylase [Enterococcus termitis]
MSSKILIEQLFNLIRIDSQNPGEYEEQISKYILQKLDYYGFEYECISFDKMKLRKNIIVYVKGTSEETIILNGHMDTKPFGDIKKWKTPPFSPTIIDGEVYGLGASDMKSGLAVMIFLLITIGKKKQKPLYNLEFHFVVDEENNSFFGCRKLCDFKYLRKEQYKLAIILEPTSARLATKSLGNKWLKIEIFGKKAHAGKYYQGVSAPRIMTEILVSITKYAETLRGLDQYPNINIGSLYGGEHPGTVQDYSSCIIDIRVLQEDHKKKLLKRIEELLAFYEIKWTMADYAPEMYSWINSFESDEIIELMMLESGQTEGLLFQGGSDAGFYNRLGLNTVIFGPGSLDHAHQYNEKVNIEEINISYKILENILLNGCGKLC